MNSLVIIDDEPAILRGLTNHIDWETLGFEVVASLEDGEDGLAYLSNHQVDVILADIRMSIISGLELAAEINRQKIKTYVVLLTGHKEFEYAQEAIRYGVREYLLKPVQRDEITRVFTQIRRELSTRLNTISDADAMRLVGENRRRLLSMLVERALTSEHALRREWSSVLLSPISSRAVAWYTLLQLGEQGTVANFEQKIGSLNRDQEGYHQIVLAEPPLYLHVLRIPRSSNTVLDVNIADIRTQLDHDSKVNLSVEREGAAKSFAELIALVQRPESEVVNMGAEDVERLVAVLAKAPHACTGDPPDSAGEFEQLVEELLSKGMCGSLDDAKVYRRAVIDVTSTVMVELQRRQPAFQLRPPLNYDGLLHCSSTQLITEWLRSELLRLRESYRNVVNRQITAIDRAMHIVESDLAGNLSLERVSSEVYLSPAYFSRMFKSERGETFLDFVTRRRIQEAQKRLLNKGFLSINQVSKSVGYSDPRYFARLFKKHVGSTPSQYRKSFISNASR